jgi:NitT/TauT family transport system permease protein
LPDTTTDYAPLAEPNVGGVVGRLAAGPAPAGASLIGLGSSHSRTGQPAGKGRRLLLGTIGIAILAALWQILPSEHVVDPTFVTPLSTVATTWWHLIQNGTLLSDTGVSLVRAGVGFGAAVTIGIPLGLLIGSDRTLADIANPVLELFRNTAPLALLPVFILILGLGQMSKFVFVAYTCLWPVMLNTISAVKTVDPLLVKSARSLGFGQLQIFQKVILPASVPQIFTGIRLAAAYALLVLIAAELVGANSGLGFLITDSQQNFQIPDMYAAIITVSLIGIVLSSVLVRVERHFSTWRATAA